jgi:MYXO-CTERM domain-containing protein
VASFVPAQGSAGPSVVTAASAPGEVVLDGVCGWAADSLLAIAGDQQEARWHWSTGSLSSAGSQKPGAPAVTMTWTESGAGTMEWGAAAVVLRPAGVVPSVPLDVQTAGCAVAGDDRHPTPWKLLALGLSWVGVWAVRRRRRQQRAAGGGTFAGLWRVI